MTDLEMSRVTRSKEAARASYDRLSRWYDLLAGSSERKFREMGLQKLDAREGESVLEIGFGTGHAVLALAQAVGESGKVSGIDISKGMFDITTAKLGKAGLADRVDLRLGDAARLPFDDRRFDAVFISFTLELFDTPEIPIVLNECRRVLAPGGRLVVVAMSQGSESGLAVRLYEWAHERIPNYVDCRPIPLERVLREASFEISELRSASMWGLPIDIVVARRP